MRERISRHPGRLPPRWLPCRSARPGERRPLLLWAALSLLLSPAAAPAEVGPAAASGLDPVIVSPSCAGEIHFPHQMHYEDLEIECSFCHHETNAARLRMPHPDYFTDFWIECTICHRESETPTRPQSCSNCHHASPTTIADQTLSSKVVTHKSCWQCHEAGTGADASRSCSLCHAGVAEGH